MPIYRRENSSVWYVTFTDASGKRVRKSSGTQDRKEAEALEAKWKLEAHQARKWDKQPTRTFDELMLGYLETAIGDLRSADTIRCHAKTLYRHFSGQELPAITPSAIRRYNALRKAEGVANATVNRELSLLSAAINYARREWEWEVANPVPGRKLKEPEGRVRWITRAEAQGLIQAAPDHLADFITLAVNTGCRCGELLGLEWNRVVLGSGLFYLEAEHTKAGKRRSVPINQTAREALLRRMRFRAENCPNSLWVFAHPDGSRIQSVKRSFGTACRRVGIADFRIHDLRHTCASWLVSAGVPLLDVRDLLGHSTIRMTERYAHLAPERARDAVSLLDGGWSHFGHSGFDEQRKSG